MSKYGIGQPVLRFEDPRLLRGQGRYINDVNLPGQAYAVFVRSPHAHAKIKSIDVEEAKKAPGVVAVLTGHDVAADGLGMPKANMPRKRPDGKPMFAPQRPPLVTDRVRYVGDPVVMVVADTLAEAKDAAELVTIDYDPLRSVTATEDTVKPGAPAVWDDCPDNISNHVERGNKAATDEAIKGAAKVIKRRYVITRVHAQYMEPRGTLGVYDQGEDRLILYADVQYPHRVRNMLAQNVFKVPESKMRVIAQDVGGGFGTKGWQYVEHRLTLWAARKLLRPVKWTCERSEAVMADEHGRDNIGEIELALDKDNKFVALRLQHAGQHRRLCRLRPQPALAVRHDRHRAGRLSDSQGLHQRRGRALQHQPDGALSRRGAAGGDLSHRAADRRCGARARRRSRRAAAQEHAAGIGAALSEPGRAVLRLRPVREEPGHGLKLADVAGFAARQADSRKRGKLRGLGIVNAIEQAAGTAQPEYAEIRFNPSGTAALLMGTKAQGQGHETMFKQILNERLGIDPKDVQYIDGDTDRVAFGMGTNGSRSTVLGGSALFVAAGKVIEKGKKLAGHLLEAGEQDIEFAEGNFTVKGTDKSVTLKQVAMAAFNPTKWPKGFEGGLYENATYLGQKDTFPNGCHICEVEVDPETGAVTVDRYAVVDDVGTVMNPIGLKGQIHGGVAQGIGQILSEQVVWDRESGQLLTASFLDYAMPRAQMIPSMEIKSNPVPTKYNPLGAKGAGEAGTVGAMPVVMNAIMDALAPLGVKDVAMPATAQNVWRAIQEAKAG